MCHNDINIKYKAAIYKKFCEKTKFKLMTFLYSLTDRSSITLYTYDVTSVSIPKVFVLMIFLKWGGC